MTKFSKVGLRLLGVLLVVLISLPVAPVGAIVDLGAYETGPNTAPSLSGLPATPVSANEDNPTAAIPFAIGDLETNVNLLTVTASAQNLSLVPDGNIAVSGSGGNRTLVVTPGTASASAVSTFVNGTTGSYVSDPIAVALPGGAIRLSWSLLNDVGVAGFNVYRRVGIVGDLVQINPVQILLSDYGVGEYFWVDSNVQPGVDYEYHLEIVWSSGEREWAGEVWIRVPKSQIYMPLLSR